MHECGARAVARGPPPTPPCSRACAFTQRVQCNARAAQIALRSIHQCRCFCRSAQCGPTSTIAFNTGYSAITARKRMARRSTDRPKPSAKTTGTPTNDTIVISRRLDLSGMGRRIRVVPFCLFAPLPHWRRDWAHRCHICTGTGLTPRHICTGTGLTAATSAPGLGATVTASGCHSSVGPTRAGAVR